MSKVTGSCLCGAITYCVDTDVRRVVNCHCDLCRRMNGSAFSSYAVVPHKALEIQGEENLGKYSVTKRATKHYCTACGTPIFNVNSKYAGACMLYLGAIEGSERLAPELNVYCEGMLSWLEGVVTLEAYREGPEG